MTDKIVGLPDEVVLSKIYLIRDQKVMFDFDLAALYDVETRALKQAVKRNIARFPEDFMFQLSKEEWQEVITICDNLPQNAKFSPATPFAFTEYGVMMLSSILSSDRAIQINIHIIRVYAKLRELLFAHKDVFIRVEQFEQKLIKQDQKIELLFTYLNKFIDKVDSPKEQIGFKLGGK